MLLNYIAVIIDVTLLFLVVIGAYNDKNWNKDKFTYCLFFLSYVMNLAALVVKW